jgi:hypothetical protein
LNESSCKARSDCRPDYCPSCPAGHPGGLGFGACSNSTDPLVQCPAACLGLPCASLDESACDARGDCHSVFVDKVSCDCAVAGCCASFSRCADGKAACKGTPLCKSATPYCEAPAYVVSYTANCYEGCVRPTECAP